MSCLPNVEGVFLWVYKNIPPGWRCEPPTERCNELRVKSTIGGGGQAIESPEPESPAILRRGPGQWPFDVAVKRKRCARLCPSRVQALSVARGEIRDIQNLKVLSTDIQHLQFFWGEYEFVKGLHEALVILAWGSKMAFVPAQNEACVRTKLPYGMQLCGCGTPVESDVWVGEGGIGKTQFDHQAFKNMGVQNTRTGRGDGAAVVKKTF